MEQGKQTTLLWKIVCYSPADGRTPSVVLKRTICRALTNGGEPYGALTHSHSSSLLRLRSGFRNDGKSVRIRVIRARYVPIETALRHGGGVTWTMASCVLLPLRKGMPSHRGCHTAAIGNVNVTSRTQRRVRFASLPSFSSGVAGQCLKRKC
ncbi:uncharacterized protein LOC131260287 [Anopheles coustani]|uniref:uncharacterized protein LOC131260287 n=1 Tax=Anopheles coustani TaxID=139045 RepID=UPI002659F95F|nr:uncharacterized protein LOC131260287 [Anopheles coustani]